eukprot:g19933.t1
MLLKEINLLNVAVIAVAFPIRPQPRRLDSTDDVTSTATWYATSSTANAIDTAADATTSVSKANTTDIEDTAATKIQDLPAYATPSTDDANVAPPMTDVALPTASTASSSRGDSNTQPCP